MPERDYDISMWSGVGRWGAASSRRWRWGGANGGRKTRCNYVNIWTRTLSPMTCRAAPSQSPWACGGGVSFSRRGRDRDGRLSAAFCGRGRTSLFDTRVPSQATAPGLSVSSTGSPRLIMRTALVASLFSETLRCFE